MGFLSYNWVHNASGRWLLFIVTLQSAQSVTQSVSESDTHTDSE